MMRGYHLCWFPRWHAGMSGHTFHSPGDVGSPGGLTAISSWEPPLHCACLQTTLGEACPTPADHCQPTCSKGAARGARAQRASPRSHPGSSAPNAGSRARLRAALWSCQTPCPHPACRQAPCHLLWQGGGARGEPVPTAGPRAGTSESDRANFPNTI
ncbi:hypothetical protein HJG60_011657 [Phyllostomus discolor]|uniref:Uncharacterized protein n=1 Tax=Phyllostomus discolor TaxID=89673 RepID=A0A834E0Z2_9CHIR|nr:hypothetical protein HJG60_011657 [Phyllostomus discolor]